MATPSSSSSSLAAAARRPNARLVFLAFVVVALILSACNALLDFESYKVGGVDGGSSSGTDGSPDGETSEGGADGGDAGCIDPTGFGGLGCYRCTPQTSEQLLNACTPSKFEPFDNAVRIKDFDAAAPKPPLENGGPLPPNFDAGAGSSSGSVASDCNFDDPGRPNPVLILGATGFPMEKLAKAMGTTTSIYYLETGSCLGVGAAVLNTPKIGDTAAVSNSGTVVYFDPNDEGKGKACKIPINPVSMKPEIMAADIAFSGSFPDTCSGADVDNPTKGTNILPNNTTLPGAPNAWQDYIGAVNPIMYAVPSTSPEKVISGEAAYRVFGFGSGTSVYAKSVAPWTDESFIFIRTQTSGTQQSIARFLGMPANALRGTNATGSSAMRKAFQLSADVPKTIGLNSSEIVDADRTAMRSLAYKHFNQAVGFYPDSDPGAYDRRNVRDGHYNMWIALHIFARTNANGDPISASNTLLETGGTLVSNNNAKTRAERDATVKRLVFVLANRQEAPTKAVDLFAAYKGLGDVPACAMRVERSKDGADLVPFTPPTSCACAFEAASPGSVPADCKTCVQPSDCTGNTAHPTCSFGFCE